MLSIMVLIIAALHVLSCGGCPWLSKMLNRQMKPRSVILAVSSFVALSQDASIMVAITGLRRMPVDA
jgi:hypothetical protein